MQIVSEPFNLFTFLHVEHLNTYKYSPSFFLSVTFQNFLDFENLKMCSNQILKFFVDLFVYIIC